MGGEGGFEGEGREVERVRETDNVSECGEEETCHRQTETGAAIV